ncbi:glycosyltransferase family 2 protein [Allorhodopirellula heiligendammensis]|uniref:Spore coat polysaccharide biosynthesis protein SpsA n=1 Tax=Allorhodopirellula heiligendammensis TaxID=2714739 RepID=A0A5C6C5H8_9BACT|nr:glycosyltransferase family A protein [Allorhodopirellula heiligendammensis]TWU18574.1 Spore coat polysaccharide biosynthesis protein SpsA [Allorhodopirellula heiligendammensis]
MQPRQTDHSLAPISDLSDSQKSAACLSTGNKPVVSAIMPTFGRPELVSESVAMFLAQDYPQKELIILNDCDGQIFRFDHPQVRVVNQSQRYATLGEKRNACIELAVGEVIAVWDDDDVYLPWRFSDAVREMLSRQAAFYRPSEFWAYWGDANLHDNQSTPGWVSHGFCCFTKKLWETVGGYPQQSLGEDAVFFKRIHEFLGLPFITMPVLKYKRPGILRGASPYQHLSINGGQKSLDSAPGEFNVRPIPIADTCLRQAAESIIATHTEAATKSGELSTKDSLCSNLPALSVCVSLKNRSRIAHQDHLLELFPKCVEAIVAASRELMETWDEPSPQGSLPSHRAAVELVVADFNSDDWPLSQWLANTADSLTLKHFNLTEGFSRGRGLNMAAMHASSDRLLFLDADMLVTAQLMRDGIEAIDQATAYFPVFRYLNIHGGLLDLEHASFGNVFLSKQMFAASGGVPEFQSWGGEDDIFYERVRRIANIRRDEGAGFYHQWHPERCRHENYQNPPQSDFHAFVDSRAADREVRHFSVSHKDWAGKISLYPDGTMQACHGDRGRYEWSDQNVLSLLWDDWPAETLFHDDESNQWKSAEYHFVIEELIAKSNPREIT